MSQQYWNQIRAMLIKNLLLKRADWLQTLFELAIPALFMGLLVWIKSITTVFDSPNVAYVCGQASPWQYSQHLDPTGGIFSCLRKPDECKTDNYYRDDWGIFEVTNITDLYTGYGYMSAAERYPFYAFTIEDNSGIYEEVKQLLGFELHNPSMDIVQLATRLKFRGQQNMIAVAPKLNTDAKSAEISELFSRYLSTMLVSENSDLDDIVHQFDSEKSIESYISSNLYDSSESIKIGFAVIFNHVPSRIDQIGSQLGDWDYSLRFNYTYPVDLLSKSSTCLYSGCEISRETLPGTKRPPTNDLLKPPSSGATFGYGKSGFLTVQKYVDEFIINYETSQEVKLEASFAFFPERAYRTDQFQQIIASTLGIFYMLAFLYPVSRMIRLLVIEKETRIKESLRMSGLREGVHNGTWLLTMLVQLLITDGVILAVVRNSVFLYSNKGLVFLWLASVSLAITSFCFLISTFFNRAKTAATLGSILFFAAFFPYFYVGGSREVSSGSIMYFAGLLAPTALALGGDTFAAWEGGLVGVQWENILDSYEGKLSYLAAVFLLLGDSVLYGVLAWYFEKVLPKEFGSHLPWYFPFTMKFWVPYDKPKGEIEGDADSNLIEPLLGYNSWKDTTAKVEAVGADLQKQIRDGKTVSLRCLHKVYEDGRIAVENLDLDLYEGHISVLLGHNGAGKSTTISIITGLISPTSGEVIVRGTRASGGGIKDSIGVCPQHDALLPSLTVAQHLKLYGAVKGIPWGDVESEARKLANEVGLREKWSEPAGSLSGGQKRKLSVAIALIGDSKVVILDEPTSGMDPYSRRSTWEVLQRHRKGRVILLTTHFMDEADVLGDRIAIMSDGTLQCLGTSLYLKRMYGVGYTMTITTAATTSIGSPDLSEKREITRLVKSYIPEVEPLSSAGGELSFRLPLSSAKNLPNLLESLEFEILTKGKSVGLSVTTLEEVFMCAGHPKYQDKFDSDRSSEDDEFSEIRTNINYSRASFLRGEGEDGVPLEDMGTQKGTFGYELKDSSRFLHFRALFWKRALYGIRDKKSLCFQLIIPTVLFLFGLLILRAGTSSFNQPSFWISPQHMFNTNLPALNRNPTPFLRLSESSLAKDIESSFSRDNLDAKIMPLDPKIIEHVEDQFGGCAQGAEPLLQMSNFLLGVPQGKDELGASRYGVIVLSENTTENVVSYNIMVNASANHAAPAFANLVHSATLQAFLSNQNASYSGSGITVRNAPLPRTKLQDKTRAALDAFTAALMVVIAFCFIPASYAIMVVKEREIKAKHQQLVSGVGALSYWSATYAFDAIMYLVPAAICLVLIYIFKIPPYTKNQGAGAAALLIFLYGPAVAPFTYCISFLFKSHSSAQNVILLLNFLTGLALMITSFVLSLLESTREINMKLRWLYRLFPGFCLGDGLAQLVLCADGSKCPKMDAKTGISLLETQGPFAMDVTGADILFLLGECLIYFVVTLIIEQIVSYPQLTSFLQRSPLPPNPDDDPDDIDVKKESIRVLSDSNDVVRFVGLRKFYSSGFPFCSGPVRGKEAVRSLSLGVKRGECFGLLGINGAGKTTALSMLSGEVAPSSGAAYVCGANVARQQSIVRRVLGYCPQFDALLELLTVREHLQLYARIKGIPRNELNAVIELKMGQLGLSEFESTLAGRLSGGNKRKLSVAIATLGDPAVCFLDEPSTGMDPLAKRKLWAVINEEVRGGRYGRAVILTTHSMEEAESLCCRMGIMVNARLRCIGTSQELKDRFGQGYEIDIKTSLSSDREMDDVTAALRMSSSIHIDTSSLKPPFEACCEALALAGLCADDEQICFTTELSLGGTGYHLTEISLAEGGGVPIRLFSDWWIAEHKFHRLQKFMMSTFIDASIVERRSLHSVRYTVPIREDQKLSKIFRLMERGRSAVGIEEYSVGQQTLESIFNSFASKQDNPEVALQTA